ncbi:MAG: hypothetical protein WCK09_15155 [Bacteroidota bacterium]
MEQWKRLYELADKLKALKPWDILHNSEIFGVRDPGSGTIGFIIFPMEEGDDPAMVVYLGERTITTLSHYLDNYNTIPPERVFEIAQMSLTFVDRRLVEKNDRDIIKAIGRKYHGKRAWPVFESIRPGMPPWFLDETEKQSMIHFLAQAIEVVSRPDLQGLFRSPLRDTKKFLIRDYEKTGDELVWKDSFQGIRKMPPVKTPFTMPLDLVKKLTAIQPSEMVVETDFFITPIPVMLSGTRPCFTYFLIIMDKINEVQIGYKILDPSSGLEPMYESIPAILLELLIKSKTRPKEIHVSSEVLAGLGPDISKKIKIPVVWTSSLPVFEIGKRKIIENLRDMQNSISPRYPRNSVNHPHS